MSVHKDFDKWMQEKHPNHKVFFKTVPSLLMLVALALVYFEVKNFKVSIVLCLVGLLAIWLGEPLKGKYLNQFLDERYS